MNSATLSPKRIFSLAAAAMSLFAVAAAPNANQPFHPPMTEAEKALDAILRRANADRDQPENLFNGRGDRSFRQTFDYSTVMTRQLLGSIKAAETALVRSTCGGIYTNEICGLEFSPVICAQDYEYPNIYRTETIGKNEITISYAGPYGTAPIATYRLVLQKNLWKIDGIACGYLGVRFHADGLLPKTDSGSDEAWPSRPIIFAWIKKWLLEIRNPSTGVEHCHVA